MKKTTLLYVLTGALALVVLVVWGGLTSFDWVCIASVTAHIALMWYRGRVIDRTTAKVAELERKLEEFKTHMDSKVDELAHRPIFPWDDHRPQIRMLP